MTPACSLPEDRAARARRGLWALLAALFAFSGCSSGNLSRHDVIRPVAMRVRLGSDSAAATLLQAQQLDRQSEAQSVDYYYQAAIQAAQGLQPCISGGDVHINETYRQALLGLIDAGQRYGRLDPRRQLIVMDGGTRVVRLRYLGFAWQPKDFSRLDSTENYFSRHIANRHTSAGLGTTLIAVRESACQNETFFLPSQPFSVTAILRPETNMVQGESFACQEYVLEFYNPLMFKTVAWQGVAYPLARDLTAPVAATVNGTPRQYLRGFTAPSDTSVKPQLIMIEPYQRGKIPVVFIHGLYSDPVTWADMINDLRAQQDLYDRYQFWAFRYPTGGDLMASAAALRQNLRLARDTYDNEHTDAAMDNMVLVGHSLGGLVSKMQVTVSYDLLWREIALQPFDALQAPPEIQRRLAEGLFFEPVPMVKRVVFIGAPHHGSGMTRRAMGLVGSALVSFGTEDDQAYHQLMADNWDLFKPVVRRKRPTTINLLDPASPFLAALLRMPVNCATHLHSVAGTGDKNPLAEPGDGVVTVASARHYGESDLLVDAKHEKLHQNPVTIAEVARILRVHGDCGR